MKSNKRKANDDPATQAKKPAKADHVNMLRAGKEPNKFMLTCLKESSQEIMKYLSKEVEKIDEFHKQDKERKKVVLKNISDIVNQRCYDVMLDKIFCSEKHTTMLYYKKYPKGKVLDEEIMRMLKNPDNSSTSKMETESSKMSTLQLESDKLETDNITCPVVDEVEPKTGNYLKAESESDKMKTEDINCPTTEPELEKTELKNINCPTEEHESDNIELKTSNCPTAEPESVKIETINSNCPTAESESDKMQTENINCHTVECESNKIGTKSSNCLTAESESGKDTFLGKMKSNKRKANDDPATQAKKPAKADHVNMLRAGKEPNKFMLTCLKESSQKIMKYLCKEVDKIDEFRKQDKERKKVVLKNISDIVHQRCYDIMLDKIFSSEKHTTMLYYKTYPKGKVLDEEIMRMLKNPDNSSTSNMETESSKMSTIQSESYKLETDNITCSVVDEVEPKTGDYLEAESESDKMKTDDTNCPTTETELDKMEIKNINCPTEVHESDNMELKTSNCPTAEPESDKMQTENINCPTKEHESDDMELKTSNCPTAEPESDKIETKNKNCPKAESESDEMQTENINCHTVECESDKIGTISTNCLTAESESEQINKIFSDGIDESMEECFKKKITNIRNYEEEQHILQCIDELPSMEDIVDDKGDKLDKYIGGTKDDNVKELNDNNNIKGLENDTEEEINLVNNNGGECMNIENEGNQIEDDNDIRTEKDRVVTQENDSNVVRPDAFRVKLISIPELPAKELILDFLNKFNTKAVKKHKTFKNLLVIDLNNEEDYKHILNANGIKIGQHRLLIRSNETSDSDMRKENHNKIVENSMEIPKVNIKQEPNDEIDERESNVVHVMQSDIDCGGGENNDINNQIIKLEPIDRRQRNIGIDIKETAVETNEVPRIINIKKEKDEVREVNSQPQNSQKGDNLQFAASLTAQPCLPDKEIIANFLKQYNPTSIKRHRTLKKILLVTFNNRTDCENLCSMNGHVLVDDGIGEIEITVKNIHEESPDLHESLEREYPENLEHYVESKELPTTSSNPTVSKKRVSGAAKKRLFWWMARGKSFDEAKILCAKPLKEFPEYIEIQASSITNLNMMVQKIAKTEPVENHDDNAASTEDNGSEVLEGNSEEVSSNNAERIRTTRKRKQLSGAAKRRIQYWMERGKTLKEAKELCSKPLIEFDEFLVEKASKIKAAMSSIGPRLVSGHQSIGQPHRSTVGILPTPTVRQVPSSIGHGTIPRNVSGHQTITGQTYRPTVGLLPTPAPGQYPRPIGQGAIPTVGYVATPAIGKETTTGEIAKASIGDGSITIGQVGKPSRELTNPMCQGTEPTGQAMKPAGQVSKLTTGQATKLSSAKKKILKELKKATTIGILDDSGPMSKERADTLKECILRLIDVTPQDEGPKFLQCSRRSGGIVFACAEEVITRAWLENAVTKICPWEGAKLRLVDAPGELRYATALIRDRAIRKDQILSLLRKQNVGLNIPTWRIVNRRTCSSGIIYTFSFDASLVETLSEREFKLYLGFDQISLRLIGPSASS